MDRWKVEVELSDVSLGTSHPRYITRQEDILSEQRVILDEVKSYLESNSEDHETHLIMVSKTKLETLENVYSQRRNELDTIQENAWKIVPLRFRKTGRVWCGGARETHWATCHKGVTPSKTKEFFKSPAFLDPNGRKIHVWKNRLSRSLLWVS